MGQGNANLTSANIHFDSYFPLSLELLDEYSSSLTGSIAEDGNKVTIAFSSNDASVDITKIKCYLTSDSVKIILGTKTAGTVTFTLDAASGDMIYIRDDHMRPTAEKIVK